MQEVFGTYYKFSADGAGEVCRDFENAMGRLEIVAKSRYDGAMNVFIIEVPDTKGRDVSAIFLETFKEYIETWSGREASVLEGNKLARVEETIFDQNPIEWEDPGDFEGQKGDKITKIQKISGEIARSLNDQGEELVEGLGPVEYVQTWQPPLDNKDTISTLPLNLLEQIQALTGCVISVASDQAVKITGESEQAIQGTILKLNVLTGPEYRRISEPDVFNFFYTEGELDLRFRFLPLSQAPGKQLQTTILDFDPDPRKLRDCLILVCVKWSAEQQEWVCPQRNLSRLGSSASVCRIFQNFEYRPVGVKKREVQEIVPTTASDARKNVSTNAYLAQFDAQNIDRWRHDIEKSSGSQDGSTSDEFGRVGTSITQSSNGNPSAQKTSSPKKRAGLARKLPANFVPPPNMKPTLTRSTTFHNSPTATLDENRLPEALLGISNLPQVGCDSIVHRNLPPNRAIELVRHASDDTSQDHSSNFARNTGQSQALDEGKLFQYSQNLAMGSVSARQHATAANEMSWESKIVRGGRSGELIDVPSGNTPTTALKGPQGRGPYHQKSNYQGANLSSIAQSQGLSGLTVPSLQSVTPIMNHIQTVPLRVGDYRNVSSNTSAPGLMASSSEGSSQNNFNVHAQCSTHNPGGSEHRLNYSEVLQRPHIKGTNISKCDTPAHMGLESSEAYPPLKQGLHTRTGTSVGAWPSGSHLQVKPSSAIRTGEYTSNRYDKIPPHLRVNGGPSMSTSERQSNQNQVSEGFNLGIRVVSEAKSQQPKHTMHQKSPGPNEIPEQSGTALLKEYKTALCRILETAQRFSGLVKLEVNLGRIIYARAQVPAELQRDPVFASTLSAFFTKQTNSRFSLSEYLFQDRLTRSWVDAEFIQNLKLPSGRRLFDEAPITHRCKVTYEFRCHNQAGREIFIEVNDTATRYQVRNPADTLGSLNWHFPCRVWDARIAISGAVPSDIQKEYGEAIQGIVDSIYIAPGQALLSMDVMTVNKDLHIDAILARRQSCYRSTVNRKLNLRLTEIQDLVLMRPPHPASNHQLQALSKSLREMIQDNRLWWEAALYSDTVNKHFEASTAPQIGEIANWRIEDILGDDLIGQFSELTKEIVTRIDNVGYTNHGIGRSQQQTNPVQPTSGGRSKAGKVFW